LDPPFGDLFLRGFFEKPEKERGSHRNKENIGIDYMASTRNRNDRGNYQLEERGLEEQRQYSLFTNQGNGKAFTNHYAGDGLLMGQMGPLALSRNFADIDSYLKGTGSTNLVTPMAPIQPSLKELESLSIIDRIPVLLPEPLKIDKNQRPLRM